MAGEIKSEDITAEGMVIGDMRTEDAVIKDMRTEDMMTKDTITETTKNTESQQEPVQKDFRRRKRKKTLTGCFPAKVLAFFLLTAGSFIAAIAAVCCVLALEEGIYGAKTFEEAFLEFGYGNFWQEAITMRNMLQFENDEWEIEHYLVGTNLDIDLLYSDAASESANAERRICGTFDGDYETDLITDIYLRFDSKYSDVEVGGTVLPTEDVYVFRVYVNPGFPFNDNIRAIYETVLYLYDLRYDFILVGLTAACAVLICFIFLMCSAGHSNRREETGQKGRPGIWLDVLGAVLTMAAISITALVHDMLSWLSRTDIFLGLLIIGALASALMLLLTAFLYELARHIKMGKWWQHTLTYIVLRGCFRALRFLGKGLLAVLRSVPTVPLAMIAYFGICFLEFMGIVMFMRPRSEGGLLWLFEKVVLFAVILYVALSCKRLLKASEAMAEGKTDYVVDTSLMIGDFKEHGENLNSISEGISKAVEARMKSERLKTELITNVSHDLKTPLTSIINYTNLIREEETENEKIKEYSEVLKRQSDRLKKLLEDLVEASKATTGNLEVNLLSCEVGVILSQAVGEYQPRLEEKHLELRITQPEKPVQIMADGRHLWRVFDNLLNNICKYAQEDTRVYLNVEVSDDQVRIIFRNMSRYPLNMSAEELEERFVRGDRSRHMEGNGLGLSIAKSLMELQGGKMEIVTDGDLFKVVLSFAAI